MDLPTVKWGEDKAIATMENDNYNEEYSEFINYSTAVIESNPIYDHTQCANCLTTNSERIEFKAADAGNNEDGVYDVIGLAKSLKVQGGDEVDLRVFGKYISDLGDSGSENIGELLATAVINTLGGNGATGTEGNILDKNDFNDFFTTGAGSTHRAANTEGISASLNYILFDENYEYVTMGYEKLSADAHQQIGAGAPLIDHEELHMTVPVAEDGYMFIYLSNGSTVDSKVYFDDFEVTHKKLVPDEGYNPDLIAYRYGFNGMEKDQNKEFGADSYNTYFRQYNPRIGRWLSLDPKLSKFPAMSPYIGLNNNPIYMVDPMGDESDPPSDKVEKISFKISYNDNLLKGGALGVTLANVSFITFTSTKDQETGEMERF